MGYSKINLDEIEPTGPGGMVRFVRRELDLQAFGINWFDLPPNAVGVHHDERESGQEEIDMIIRGSGTYVIDGDTERGPKAGPGGLVMVAVGARRGSYEPRGPY
jgi:hypothetical protein